MEVMAIKRSRSARKVISTTARIASCLHLVIFLLAAAVSGCGGGSGGGEAPAGPRPPIGINISGKAAIEGTPLTGAVVAISKLDITQASENKSRRGKIVNVELENFQPTVASDGVFSFQVPIDLLQDDILYSLSLTCPQPITDTCSLQTPLHAVLSGSRLKQSGFTVNVLTEVVYQRLGYYIAVGFKAPELQQEMNALARMLLDGDIDGENGVEYEDVLRWVAGVTDAASLRRPVAVAEITEHLYSKEDADQIQRVVQTLFSPIVASLNTNNYALLIATEGSYAYVTVGPKELYAVDISKPMQPIMLSKAKVSVPGHIQKMTLVSPFVYVTYHSDETGGGLQIVDISNPLLPQLRGNISLTGKPSHIQVVGSNAYIAYKPADDMNINLPSGLHIVNVSNADAPTRTAELNLDNPDDINDRVVACGVAVVGKHAYITDIWGSIYTVDISTSEKPRPVGSTFASARLCDIKVKDNIAYMGSEFSGLQIWSLENPENIEFVANIEPLGAIRNLAIKDDFAYITDSTGGLMIADISNPKIPKLVSAIDTPGSANDVALANNFAYVADTDGGVKVIEYTVQPAPHLAGIIASGGVDVVADENYAYVLSSFPGLKVVNILDATSIVVSSTIKGYNSPCSVSLGGQYLFASAGDYIEIIDIRDPESPTHKGELQTPGQGKDVALVGNLAFIAHGYEGLRVVNISDPAFPHPAIDLDTPGAAHGIDVAGDYAYIADSEYGLQAIKFSQTDELKVELGPAVRVDTPGSASEVVVSGNIAYVADSQAGLQLIDISNPDKPRLIGGVDTPGNAIDVTIMNSIAYVADDFAGVQVIDVRDPYNPTLIGAARTNSGAMGISAAGDHIYVATHFGLEILHAIPTE